jgi:hypothetical protein
MSPTRRQVDLVRVLVTWSPCGGADLDGHVDWAQREADELRRCDAVVALALHPPAAGGAAARLTQSLCLELRLGQGCSAEKLIRERRFVEFLARLRLFGMPPIVVPLEDDV